MHNNVYLWPFGKKGDGLYTHTHAHTHANYINWAIGDRDFREHFSLQTLLTFEFYAMRMYNITYFLKAVLK